MTILVTTYEDGELVLHPPQDGPTVVAPKSGNFDVTTHIDLSTGEQRIVALEEVPA
jgi:hypothetical protein